MSDVLNKAAFRVFRGKESSIFNQDHQDGYVYFATDTGKIYMDTATEEKVLMGGGGNSGIYYAKKKFTDPADLTFSISDITTNELPDINDLVINVSADIGGDIERDGFYQVVEVIELENKVITNYLPVGGGGGGGTGSGGTTGFASIDYIVPKDGVASTLISEPYWIEYKLTAQDSAGDTVPNTGTATWIINGKTIDGGQVSPGDNKFNVTPYLDAKLDVNSIKLSVSINTGSSINTIVSKIWQITAIDLQLEWNHTYSPDSYINSSTFSVSFTPWGNVACKAYLLFDTNEDYRYTMDIPASRTGKPNSFPTMNSLPYGTHKAQMWLTASINGKDYRTPTITHELTFTYGGTSTIITSPFNQVEATQYDTIRIPFLIYNPETALNKMRILVNDEEVSPYTEYDQKLQNFDYTIGRSGIIKIVLEHDANIKKEFELSVTPLELDVEEPQTPSYKLKASDIVDNTALRATPGLTFSSNFDWQNGGMKSETSADGVITKYICVKNGTTMTIDYELFNNNATQYGKNFKFIFKATNCYKYDAQVLKCFDTTSNIGIDINAQRAVFNSGANILKSDYCENSYIELEMEVWPKSNIDQYMMLWVDGIPSNVQVYESSTFKQHNPQMITIGSNDCDVYVYLVKIYERYLNEIEHLDNFIMDAPNTQEKVQRYKRNDILDNSGDISYKKLVKNNPGCHAYLYDIPQMTKDKDTKIDCYYSEYCNDPDKPIITADKAKMFVQGTSSAAYGVAAFNLRTDFRKTTMYDGDGNVIEGKEVSETAIPINYTCTKVNVASCENANNVYNQEWYNRFQPYHDGHRRKTREDGKLYRDCMEFDFGVVFVKDNNPNGSYKDTDGKPSEKAYLDANVFSDTAGYVDEPYYKQYAVANMGNDKKNVEVFHDTENPLACCVEVANNQTDKQFMVENITLNDVAVDNTENFEFRYPDGNGEASAEMKAGWVRFVNWMADSNPAAATNASIINLPVEQRTFEPYTFRGFNPPGYEGEESPTGVSLKGVTVSAYATDKQLDAEGKWVYDEEGKVVKSDTPIPYTHDTYEYRMAKMLKECEDYLVMDSVVFHYLFIQRHTMIDNVAKNTFWSSEDCVHWDLTKNYDNDTSDGNDNSGYLIYNYGLEILDENAVFNAPKAVWLNFIHGLDEAQESLFKALEQKGAWRADNYLAAFNKSQSLIPERCWIQDYFRKYIRPRRLGLDPQGAFLKRLEGGKKTHQRKQYETYQEYYLNSKYMAGSSFTESASLDLRLNALEGIEWDRTSTIPITAYIDLYPSALIGTTGLENSWRGARLTRGETAYIPVGKILASPKDGTCYIFAADMIQSIANLHNVYPSYATLSRAKRLRTLELGSDETDYYNPKLRMADISGNSMLETALIQNSGNLEYPLGALNLNKYNEELGYEPLKALKTLKIDGSNFTELTLADNGLLETLALNDLTSLSMSNLQKLNSVTYEDGIEDSLQTLYVDNCSGINTQYLVENCNLLNYYLLGINWTITQNSLNEDNELKKIDVLEKLLKAKPKENQKNSLSGTIKIDLSTAFSVDEYEIYNTYQKEFPNVTIMYGTNAIIKKAPKIIFKKDDIGEEILYWVLTDGTATQTLETLTSLEGPAGEAIKNPSKTSTSMYTYFWNVSEEDKDNYNWIYDGYQENEWKDENGNEYTHAEMLALKPANDMIFTPIFSTAFREYTVHVKDYDAEYLPGYPKIVTYGQDLSTEIPKYMERVHNEEEKRWSFKGWISAADFLSNNQNPTFITDFRITSDLTIYAFYKEEKVTEVATDYKYFNISEGAITLKTEYLNSLSGKITLPSMDENGNYITTIGEEAFRNASLITAVYFLEDAKYTVVGDSAFRSCPILTKVMLPNSIATIKKYAFSQSRELLDVNILKESNTTLTTIEENAFSGGPNKMKITVDELPKNLVELGSNAFQNAGPNVKVTKIPDGIEVLKQFCFTYCDKVQVTYFGSDGSGSQLKEIQQRCFYSAGNGTLITTDNRIYFDKSVITFGANCFSGSSGIGYLYNIKNASFARPKTDYAVSGDTDFINYTGIQVDGRTVTFGDNDNT